ncbi:unnamed protein product [Pleuronectes platessa]|uniref:Uncharacterized protein n=1 Tax=Pleuronectes platessa TaxID=8262 RepID=A0A9N7Y591_PLEPL|nr:unnamed protein product [Pleuronectes platessa]
MESYCRIVDFSSKRKPRTWFCESPELVSTDPDVRASITTRPLLLCSFSAPHILCVVQQERKRMDRRVGKVQRSPVVTSSVDVGTFLHEGLHIPSGLRINREELDSSSREGRKAAIFEPPLFGTWTHINVSSGTTLPPHAPKPLYGVVLKRPPSGGFQYDTGGPQGRLYGGKAPGPRSEPVQTMQNEHPGYERRHLLHHRGSESVQERGHRGHKSATRGRSTRFGFTYEENCVNSVNPCPH